MSIDSTLRKAAKLAKQGKRAAAAALYNEVLAQFPANATARKGLAALATPAPAPARRPAAAGNARRAQATGGPAPAPQQLQALERMLAAGNPRAAIAEGQRLALLFPRAPALLNLLGLAQSRAGQHEAAVSTFDRLIALDPTFAGAQVNKANALAKLGRNDEVVTAARAALALNPNLATAQTILGYGLVNSGHAEDALEPFRAAVRLAPNLLQTHIGLGNAYAALGRHAEALEAFETGRPLDPENIDLINNIGNALVALARADEAVEILSAGIRKAPKNPILRANFARALRDFGRTAEAIEACKASLALTPNDAETMEVLGSCYREVGDKARAIEILDKAVRLNPNNLGTLALRWQMESLPLDSPDYAAIKARTESPELSKADRAKLELSLFVAHDKADDRAQAFAHLARCKRLRRETEPYNIADHSAMFETLKAQFSDNPAPLDATALAEIPAPHKPVLIVGMPRSGTTLVEQILASHSQVHGAGELPALGNAMRDLGWTKGKAGKPPQRDALMQLRSSYFAALNRLGAAKPVITDKAPLNFRMVGHALLAMPEARVLVMRRDARATCWSNFSNSFLGRANNFGHDMADTAKMYLMHLDLVAFWQKLFPDQVTVVPYERLTEHQEEESRKLVAAAGLDWEEACLEFYKTKRSVRTVSASQVRQKMYTGSSEAWRRYEPFLGPMLEVLKAGGALDEQGPSNG